METLEHFARIQLVAELLGGPKVLPRVEVDALLDSRTRYGVKAASAGEPGCPVALEDLGTAKAAACGVPSPAQSRTNEEHFYVSRSELIGVVEEVLRARGLA
jgi:L-fuculose-phosphate aldolase